MLKTLRFIFASELILLLRRSQEWLYPLGFFVIVISLFPLAFSPNPATLQALAPGLIWIAALFANLLASENIFFTDTEDGHIEQLLLSPLPLSLLVLIKISAQWLVTQLPLILLTPLLSTLFHLSLHTIFILCISLLFGTPILTLLSSLGVALTLGLRQQGILLGLLILPLATPVLIFGVNIAQQSQSAFPFTNSLAFLAGLCMLAATLLPLAIATTLRLGADE